LPEGGTRAWLSVLGVWLVQFANYGYTNAYGVYNDYYVRIYLNDRPASDSSWIGSVQWSFSLIVGLWTGRIFDQGYFYHLMAFGSFLSVFSLFMLSLSQPHQYYQIFLSQGVGLGLGIGIVYAPSLGLISHYFNRRRPLALTLAVSGTGLGGMIHPILLNALIYSKLGFAGAVRVSAALDAVLLIAALLLMRPRYGHKQGAALQARHVGFWTNLKNFYTDPPFVFTSLGLFISSLSILFPTYFLQLNAIKRGIDPKLAFYTLTMLNGTNFLGRLLSAPIIDWFGPFNSMTATTFCCAVLIFALQGITDAVGTVVFALLYGFFAGIYGGIAAPLISSLASDRSEVGARIGICWTAASISGLVGSPIAGWLLGRDFKWTRPIAFSGVRGFWVLHLETLLT
ncbi:MFS general substrate transporter, partial [Pterulicium gracile]